ncbi:MAG: hypothetical protein AAGC95_02375, partial [Pseudomonadota bacterium]
YFSFETVPVLFMDAVFRAPGGDGEAAQGEDAAQRKRRSSILQRQRIKISAFSNTFFTMMAIKVTLDVKRFSRLHNITFLKGS